MRVRLPLVGVTYQPTALHEVAARHDTPLRALETLPGPLGLDANLSLSRWEAGDDLPDLPGWCGDRDILRPPGEEAMLERPPSSGPTGMVERHSEGPSRRGLHDADLAPLLQRTGE